MISGTTRYQPESARGTIGISTSDPDREQHESRPDDAAGRRLPARFPASSAIANMLSDSGASDRPASIALYSSTICR